MWGPDGNDEVESTRPFAVSSFFFTVECDASRCVCVLLPQTLKPTTTIIMFVSGVVVVVVAVIRAQAPRPLRRVPQGCRGQSGNGRRGRRNFLGGVPVPVPAVQPRGNVDATNGELLLLLLLRAVAELSFYYLFYCSAVYAAFCVVFFFDARHAA